MITTESNVLVLSELAVDEPKEMKDGFNVCFIGLKRDDSTYGAGSKWIRQQTDIYC